jgi:hypothetical protein
MRKEDCNCISSFWWTLEEEAYILAHYNRDMTPVEVGAALGRSYKQVRTKASYMRKNGSEIPVAKPFGERARASVNPVSKRERTAAKPKPNPIRIKKRKSIQSKTRPSLCVDKNPENFSIRERHGGTYVRINAKTWVLKHQKTIDQP